MEVEQQDGCHAGPELPNTRSKQRYRTMETPVDNGLVGTIVISMNAISLASLFYESVDFITISIVLTLILKISNHHSKEW